MAEIARDNGRDGVIEQIDILWITAGLGCDGDTIAMTAATQPSIEDVVMGGDPVDSQSQFPQSISRHGEWRRLSETIPSGCGG